MRRPARDLRHSFFTLAGLSAHHPRYLIREAKSPPPPGEGPGPPPRRIKETHFSAEVFCNLPSANHQTRQPVPSHSFEPTANAWRLDTRSNQHVYAFSGIAVHHRSLVFQSKATTLPLLSPLQQPSFKLSKSPSTIFSERHRVTCIA